MILRHFESDDYRSDRNLTCEISNSQQLQIRKPLAGDVTTKLLAHCSLNTSLFETINRVEIGLTTLKCQFDITYC